MPLPFFVAGRRGYASRFHVVGRALMCAVFLVGLGTVSSKSVSAADADDVMATRSVERSFADARVDLQNAIVNQGLAIDFNGKIGDMLKRTAKDVGAKGEVYADAEYFTFCSSVLSRRMMDADPLNMGLCPYVMFVYESVGSKGKVTVGYKRMPMRGATDSQSSLKEINILLEKILLEATD